MHPPPPSRVLTCWACYHYRPERPTYTPAGAGTQPDRCNLGQPGFPSIGNQCTRFDYEPGSDQPPPQEPQQ